MARDTFYTAIDIGSDKVTSVVARVGGEGELKVLGTGVVPSEGVQKGRIENLAEAQGAVANSLAEAQRYVGKGVVAGGVYASISGTHLTCLNTKEALDNPENPGNISAQLMDKLLQRSFPESYADSIPLHVIPTGYTVDGMSGVRNPMGLHGNQVEVEAHVVLGEAAVLRNTTRAVEANRVELKSLVLESFASSEATLTADEREMGVMLLDIGGGTTDVVIYRQGNPWYSAVVPLGGQQLTRDLSVALRSPLHTAEEIKVKWGSVFPDGVPAEDQIALPSFQGQPKRVVARKDVAGPLSARMYEIIKLALVSVRQSGLRELPTGGMVVTGGSAEIQGLVQAVSQMVGGPVRIGYPDGIIGLPAQLRKPAFSAAVGLLLWGIKHQDESQASRVRRSRNAGKPRAARSGGWWGSRSRKETAPATE